MDKLTLAGKITILLVTWIRIKMAKTSEAKIKMRSEISRQNEIINAAYALYLNRLKNFRVGEVNYWFFGQLK